MTFKEDKFNKDFREVMIMAQKHQENYLNCMKIAQKILEEKFQELSKKHLKLIK